MGKSGVADDEKDRESEIEEDAEFSTQKDGDKTRECHRADVEITLHLPEQPKVGDIEEHHNGLEDDRGRNGHREELEDGREEANDDQDHDCADESR